MSGRSDFPWCLVRIHTEHFCINWLQSAYHCLEQMSSDILISNLSRLSSQVIHQIAQATSDKRFGRT